MATTQRLRLLQVILSRGFAGSERAVAETCNALASLDHDVAIVLRADHRKPDGSSIVDYLDRRVRIFQVPRYWRTQARVAHIVRDWNPDLIHTHLRRGTRLVARIRARSDVAHVSTLHIRLNGRHYLRTHALFCISEWQVATVPGHYRGHTYLLPNTLVSEARLSGEERHALRASIGLGPDDFAIGSVGRLVRSKGVDVLIRSFAAAAVPTARLLVVGDGSDQARLRELAGPDVRFLGYRSDAKRLMQAFDLFVCPSRSEPFGRVIIEALDAGTPVIASDVDGPRDIAEAFPVQLVPADDVAALAHALRSAAACGPRRVECELSMFSADRVVPRLVHAYGEVIQSEQRRIQGRRADPRQAHA